MRAWLAEHGINHLYVYGKDEARGEELALQLPIWRRLHRAVARIMAAGSIGHIDWAGRETDVQISHAVPTADEFARMRSYGNLALVRNIRRWTCLAWASGRQRRERW
jgi:hypothetical protein